MPGERQGGDTILDAVAISVPGTVSGTTAGYNDDYDEVCPYSQSTSPDVVYAMTPGADIAVDIDLYGSTYDTKVYVYDANLALVACNDDFYPDFVSKLENVALNGGAQYYVVIDGYGGDFGEYLLTIVEYVPCVLEWLADSELEEEPPLVDDYPDAHNGGCNSPEFGNPFGYITWFYFHGVSGWYVDGYGGQKRDTDWFEIVVPLVGYVEITGDAEFATYSAIQLRAPLASWNGAVHHGGEAVRDGHVRVGATGLRFGRGAAVGGDRPVSRGDDRDPWHSR